MGYFSCYKTVDKATKRINYKKFIFRPEICFRQIFQTLESYKNKFIILSIPLTNEVNFRYKKYNEDFADNDSNFIHVSKYWKSYFHLLKVKFGGIVEYSIKKGVNYRISDPGNNYEVTNYKYDSVVIKIDPDKFKKGDNHYMLKQLITFIRFIYEKYFYDILDTAYKMYDKYRIVYHKLDLLTWILICHSKYPYFNSNHTICNSSNYGEKPKKDYCKYFDINKLIYKESVDSIQDSYYSMDYIEDKATLDMLKSENFL